MPHKLYTPFKLLYLHKKHILVFWTEVAAFPDVSELPTSPVDDDCADVLTSDFGWDLRHFGASGRPSVSL